MKQATMILTKEDFRSKNDGYHLNVFEDILDSMRDAGYKIPEGMESVNVVFTPYKY